MGKTALSFIVRSFYRMDLVRFVYHKTQPQIVGLTDL